MPRPLNPDSGRYELKAKPARLRLWAKAAAARELPLSSWIRRTLNRAAYRTLDKAAEQQPRKKRK